MKKINNHFVLNFSGYSMYPFLKPGDRIIVKRISPSLFKVGDIVVVFTTQKHFVVHRLVKILPNGKGIIKGDSLLAVDPEAVMLSTLSGKVVAILRRGRFTLMSTRFGSRIQKVYAFLSINGLTYGAMRLKVKSMLIKKSPLRKSNSHNKEWRFIISILGNRSHQKPSTIDWIRVNEIASSEGVIGILYKQLKDKEIPESTLSSFRDYYRSVAAQNVINLTTLDRLERVLNNEKIEVMTLKGASLLNNIYHDIGMRPMGDLDLMVRPEERNRFIIILKNLGYTGNPLSPYFYTKDRVVIDLHTHALNIDRITNRAALFPAGMDPVWANSVPLGERHRWLRRPDDIDNVLLLSQHFMKHSFSKLIWLIDILRLIKKNDGIFITDLLKRAEYLDQQRNLYYTLYLINRMFFHRSTHRKLSRLEHGILETRINGQPIDLIGPLMAMLCIRGFRKKVAFGLESLFPKNEAVKQGVSGALCRVWKIVKSLLGRFHIILGHIFK